MTLAPGVRNSLISVVVAAAVVTSCSSSSLVPSQTDASPKNDLAGGRVLFIGNSLTEANGLPAVVETPSCMDGDASRPGAPAAGSGTGSERAIRSTLIALAQTNDAA